jgi:fused signal recognition particle receptor
MALQDVFRSVFPAKMASIFSPARNQQEIFTDLEELLILADIAVPIVEGLMAGLKKKAGRQWQKEDFIAALGEELLALFPPVRPPVLDAGGKNVILLVGVNGSGKTTSAAKLAHWYRQRGRRVLLAAADTFRAAGATQLERWGERLSVPVISGERGADPGSVVFNSLQSWQSRDFDLLLIDTAGRMQSKENLMRELLKLVRIIKKFSADQPAETWLVLDASTGQNALSQAEKFAEFSQINGVLLAKLDGSAKGGTVIRIAERLKLPVRFAGIGEGAEDLWEFSAPDFVRSLLGQ